MRPRDLVCLIFLGAALLASVLIIGGALRWVQAVVAGLVALGLATQLLSRRRLQRTSPLIAWLGAAAVLTTLQLVPLPAGVLDALSPVGTQLRADGAAIAGTSPWPCLSLDPAASLRALMMLVTLLGVALLGVRFSVVERGRYLVLAGVAVTCGLAALVADVHTMLNATALYGIYAPAHAPLVFGPLLNQNHMGGLMAIGATAALGLGFYSHQKTQLRILWVGICVLCSIACAMTLSRGAMIGLGLGSCLVMAVMISARVRDHKRRREHGWRRDLPMALVIGLGVALALYASAGNVTGQIHDTSFTELSRPITKYAAWKSSLTLVRESPWVGVGRGATETTLTRVHPASSYFTFAHLENEYLTVIVEWGIPGALLLGALFTWCVLVAMRRWRDGPLAAAALGALAAIGFQSSVDFGIELLGLAVPVVLLASTVQLVPLRPEDALGRVRGVRLLLVLALAAGAWLARSDLTRSAGEDHDDLLVQPHVTLAELRPAIERHPLDYFGYGLGADIASRADDVTAAAWLNHALRLHPTHPGLHRLAARMLVGVKLYSQAAIEYSLALDGQAAPGPMLKEIVALVPDADDAAAAIPTDYPRPEVIHHTLDQMKRGDIDEKWLARVAALPQHDVRAIDAWFELAQARGDLAAAEEAAELRLSVSRTSSSRLRLAKVQLARAEYPALLTELADVRSWSGRTDEKAEAWMILCDVHIAQKNWDAALECLHHLDGSGLYAGGRAGIDGRLKNVNEAREYEEKMKAIDALQKSVAP